MYHKLKSLTMKSLFKDGKLIEFSDEALYFLYKQQCNMRQGEIKRNEKMFYCKLCKVQLYPETFDHMLMAHDCGYSCPICDVADFKNSAR